MTQILFGVPYPEGIRPRTLRDALTQHILETNEPPPIRDINTETIMAYTVAWSREVRIAEISLNIPAYRKLDPRWKGVKITCVVWGIEGSPKYAIYRDSKQGLYILVDIFDTETALLLRK